jgi:hypothetical protein
VTALHDDLHDLLSDDASLGVNYPSLLVVLAILVLRLTVARPDREHGVVPSREAIPKVGHDHDQGGET